jgi:hypothetical protein
MSEGRFVVSEDPPEERTLAAVVSSAMTCGAFIVSLLDEVDGRSIHRDVLLAAWQTLSNLQQAVLVWTYGLNGEPQAKLDELAAGLGRPPSEVTGLQTGAMAHLRMIIWPSPLV